MAEGSIKIKRIKDEPQREFYLVGLEDVKEAPRILMGHLKDRNIQFSSMKVMCLVEKGARHNIVDWDMPFSGTLIKVNFKNR